MKTDKTGFLEESPNVKSSKRLLALIFALYAIAISTFVYLISEDSTAFIAVWSATTATVLILIGVGKYQENVGKRIENQKQ